MLPLSWFTPMLTPPPSKVWLAPECQTGKSLLLQKWPEGFRNAQSFGSFLTFTLKKIKHTILSVLYLIFKNVLEFVPHLAGLIQRHNQLHVVEGVSSQQLM